MLVAQQAGAGDPAGWIADNLAMIEVVLRTADEPPITGVLHRWHERLTRHGRLPDHMFGACRTALGWVGGSSPIDAAYVAPPSEIPQLGDDLAAFADDDGDLDAVSRAVLAHAQFEVAHSDSDGTGRAALTTLAATGSSHGSPACLQPDRAEPATGSPPPNYSTSGHPDPQRLTTSGDFMARRVDEHCRVRDGHPGGRNPVSYDPGRFTSGPARRLLASRHVGNFGVGASHRRNTEASRSAISSKTTIECRWAPDLTKPSRAASSRQMDCVKNCSRRKFAPRR